MGAQGRIAVKGTRECRVLGMGCGLHTAPGSESRPAGYGVLTDSPLEKVRDGLATEEMCRHMAAGWAIGSVGLGLGGTRLLDAF